MSPASSTRVQSDFVRVPSVSQLGVRNRTSWAAQQQRATVHEQQRRPLPDANAASVDLPAIDGSERSRGLLGDRGGGSLGGEEGRGARESQPRERRPAARRRPPASSSPSTTTTSHDLSPHSTACSRQHDPALSGFRFDFWRQLCDTRFGSRCVLARRRPRTPSSHPRLPQLTILSSPERALELLASLPASEIKLIQAYIHSRLSFDVLSVRRPRALARDCPGRC